MTTNKQQQEREIPPNTAVRESIEDVYRLVRFFLSTRYKVPPQLFEDIVQDCMRNCLSFTYNPKYAVSTFVSLVVRSTMEHSTRAGKTIHAWNTTYRFVTDDMNNSCDSNATDSESDEGKTRSNDTYNKDVSEYNTLLEDIVNMIDNQELADMYIRYKETGGEYPVRRDRTISKYFDTLDECLKALDKIDSEVQNEFGFRFLQAL